MLRVTQSKPLLRLGCNSTHAARVAPLAARVPRRLFFSLPDAKIDIEAESKALHTKVLLKLNSKVLGPLEKHSDSLPPMPMVFALGNHSSGKSSFINFVLGREVQTTGVAPTDDGFTIVAPDADQDGPALIGDGELGFSGLRQFGTSLINHVGLKIRQDLSVRNIMMVDSPGMIDSPISMSSSDTYSQIRTNASPRDRGYNFPGVVRWFAERADVILLFFDPDKPGTTGETMACMTNSLAGMDHKVHIILNKVDQFKNVHDFGRAYGSLCWNLSKVIPRKDLPRVYTMCLPGKSNDGLAVFGDTMGDLQRAREEVMHEVHKAPLRRIDNMISRLYDNTRLLKMHCQVLEAVRQEVNQVKMRWYGMAGVSTLVFGTLTAGSVTMGVLPIAAVTAAMGTLGSAGMLFYANSLMAAMQKDYVERGKLDAAFQKVHFMQLAEKDDFVISLWDRIRPQVINAIQTLGVGKLPRVSTTDIHNLDAILDVDVPRLRKVSSKMEMLLNDELVDLDIDTPLKKQ